ncbi:hypothetical protein [Streptomyces violarus]|uniref:hypothetical protein n=1 Tax=Streptomyces violarus TaxID=67380 RepID=UPI0021BECDF1|nr:hypothetical protein [Streptomyces violarus]MCT9139735.1 hypothetical protein [Streptomyces violarus]
MAARPFPTSAALRHRDRAAPPRRLFVVESGRTLWETPRDNVAEATVKQFSVGRKAFRLSFQDGSWARLTPRLSTHTTELVDLLNGGTVPERGQSPTAQP